MESCQITRTVVAAFAAGTLRAEPRLTAHIQVCTHCLSAVFGHYRQNGHDRPNGSNGHAHPNGSNGHDHPNGSNGQHATAAIPTAALPTAALPTAALPTAALPTAALPTAALTTATMPPPPTERRRVEADTLKP